jgi:SOS response regulatory protein OraA/RecX
MSEARRLKPATSARGAAPRPSRTGPARERLLPSEDPSAPAITAVDADPQDPNLRRVKVGRRLVARLPATAAEAHGVEVGKPWSAALAAAVARDAALAVARDKALRSLGRSAATSTRLIERLVRSGQDPTVAAEAVASLRRDGWLDESAAAEDFAQRVQRSGRLPSAALAHRLQAKGVDPALAERVSKSRGAASPAAERAACLALATSLVNRGGAATRPSARASDPAATARRVAAALARKGFDADIIARTLESLRLSLDAE